MILTSHQGYSVFKASPFTITPQPKLGGNPLFRPYWDAIVEGSGEPLSEDQILELVGHDESFACYPENPKESNSPADSDSQLSVEDSQPASTEWSFAASSQQSTAGSETPGQDARSIADYETPRKKHKSDDDAAGVERRFTCPFNNNNCRGKRRNGPYTFYAAKKYNLERHIRNCHGREWQSRCPEQRRQLLANSERVCSKLE